MSRTIALTIDQAEAVSLIGKSVTVGDRQYTCHSIEGGSWYAHLNSEGLVVIDTLLSGGHWITQPLANLLPAGCELGQGFMEEHPLSQVKRGVTLVKSYA